MGKYENYLTRQNHYIQLIYIAEVRRYQRFTVDNCPSRRPNFIRFYAYSALRADVCKSCECDYPRVGNGWVKTKKEFTRTDNDVRGIVLSDVT